MCVVSAWEKHFCWWS